MSRYEYYRVSPDKQAEASLESQLQSIQEYVKNNNLIIGDNNKFMQVYVTIFNNYKICVNLPKYSFFYNIFRENEKIPKIYFADES